MRLPAWLVAALLAPLLAFMPRASGQVLPDLGSAADAPISVQMERRIGESVVRDIRARDPSYLDDPEIEDYLGALGAKLAQANPGTRLEFEFFVIRDSTVNAFALPGGFVGVHTGLITIAETESELASVLGHEIAHVTERHMARMLGRQQQMQAPVLAAMAAAILLGRSRPDLAAAGLLGAQGAAIQTSLAYTRDFEREADRVGLQSLQAAGFDARAMAVFFERLQRSTRLADDGSVPGYLRTHPLTTERIADAQARAAELPYRQRLDSPEFQLVRAKLRAESGEPRDAVSHFEASVREKRYASEAAARYGLAAALLRAKRPKDADTELTRLRATGSVAMVETLAARIRQALGDKAGAIALLSTARVKFPYSRPLLYAQVDALEQAGRTQEALAAASDAQRLYPRDARLYGLQSKAYAALGKRFLQHQAQAEVYALQGSLPAAIEQLQLARAANDGDFYQQSVVDVRLKELRAAYAQETKDMKR
ncbi:MAG TPA: M48 family metalloprotease [Burkholderiales bacterium]